MLLTDSQTAKLVASSGKGLAENIKKESMLCATTHLHDFIELITALRTLERSYRLAQG